MRDPEDTQDRSESELDIEEIDNSITPRRLRSRPRELTSIDREEFDENPPPRSSSDRMSSLGGRKPKRITYEKIFQITALIILGILLLSNYLLIGQINFMSNIQRGIDSNVSLLINNSSDILNNISILKEEFNMQSLHPNNFAANSTTNSTSNSTANNTVENLLPNENSPLQKILKM